MRVQPATSAAAGSPEHFVEGEGPRLVDSRYDLCSYAASPLELAVHNESERLRRAVADFVAACRTEHVPPDAVVTRFEAFLAAYSADARSTPVTLL